MGFSLFLLPFHLWVEWDIAQQNCPDLERKLIKVVFGFTKLILDSKNKSNFSEIEDILEHRLRKVFEGSIAYWGIK